MSDGKEGRAVIAAAVLSCIVIALSWYAFFIKDELAAAKEAEKQEAALQNQEAESRSDMAEEEPETGEPDPYTDTFAVNYEAVRKTVGMEEPQITEASGAVYILETVTPFSYGISAGSGDFSYCYPKLLYSHVETVWEEELMNAKSETIFTSDTDDSSLTVIYQTNNSKNHSEIKDILLEKAQGGLSDVQVIVNTSDSDVSRYYVNGREGNLVVWELAEVIGGKIYQMIVKYPEPTDEEDAQIKEYYADCLYRLCGFSGQSNRALSWEAFHDG